MAKPPMDPTAAAPPVGIGELVGAGVEEVGPAVELEVGATVVLPPP